MKGKNGRNKGFALIYLAIALVVLLALAGMAIDIGYMYLTKAELQNAADAGALAGAGTLYPKNSTSFPPPDWTGAASNATLFVQKNKAVNAYLADATVQTGYWNLKTNSPSGGSWSQSITPSGSCSTTTTTSCTATSNNCPSGESCLIQDVPAVQVTVSRSPGNNGGPVPSFLARIVGWTAFSVHGTAVGVSGFPESVGNGNLFPIAVTSCMVNSYFAQKPLPATSGVCGATDPFPCIQISSAYSKVPGCDTGQWTSFFTGNNDVPTVRSFITNGNSGPLRVGDNIWIEPGVKASIYDAGPQTSVKTWIANNAGSGDVALFPVVNGKSMQTHANMTITGFVAFKIDGYVKNGNSSYIYGHFVKYYETLPGSSPGGSQTNSAIPPVLKK